MCATSHHISNGRLDEREGDIGRRVAGRHDELEARRVREADVLVLRRVAGRERAGREERALERERESERAREREGETAAGTERERESARGARGEGGGCRRSPSVRGEKREESLFSCEVSQGGDAVFETTGRCLLRPPTERPRARAGTRTRFDRRATTRTRTPYRVYSARERGHGSRVGSDIKELRLASPRERRSIDQALLTSPRDRRSIDLLVPRGSRDRPTTRR